MIEQIAENEQDKFGHEKTLSSANCIHAFLTIDYFTLLLTIWLLLQKWFFYFLFASPTKMVINACEIGEGLYKIFVNEKQYDFVDSATGIQIYMSSAAKAQI